MPQTLLALLAMILASLVSFSQQRQALTTYDAMLDNEIEMAASGVMMHVLEMVGGRSFDERSTPDGIRDAGSVLPGTNNFSPASSFGHHDRGSAGCDLEEAFQTPLCDDIDDVSSIRNAVVYARFSDGRTLPFKVDLDVDYVVEGEAQTPSPTPTNHKRVTLTARSSYLPHGHIVLERVFSYDEIKAEMDYEAIYGAIGT